jgi:steroid delta-isomerase-like uncharacterized protein
VTATGSGTAGEEERNKRLALRFYEEFWTKGNADAADELVAEDVDHGQMPDGWPPGREGFKRLVRTWREAFPDMREEVSLLIAEGDWTAGWFRLRGTHRGDFYGLPATGRHVDIRGVDLLRFRDGRIVQWIYSEDALGLFLQLGAFPPDIGQVAGPSPSSG